MRRDDWRRKRGRSLVESVNLLWEEKTIGINRFSFTDAVSKFNNAASGLLS